MKKLLYLLLGILGFTACGEGGAGGGGMMCEYGTPTADFTVKGKVTNADGKPIKGIEISSKDLSSFIDGSGLSAVTAEDGTFVTNKIKEFGVGGTLVFTDTDGEANGGEFVTLEKQISTLPQKQIKDRDGWYRGEYEVTADVKLKKR